MPRLRHRPEGFDQGAGGARAQSGGNCWSWARTGAKMSPTFCTRVGTVRSVRSDGRTWLFTATGSSTRGWTLTGGRLQLTWQKPAGGTSPVVAGGLLYVYDPSGGLRVRRPTDGGEVATLPAGSGHWSSPIVTDGRIALPEGDANEHRTSGVLDVYRLP